ncbi:hypothetical protein KIN20_002306 [Parelaphostrongylus tenuis]|uniref:Nose resistant-to-fluoxetine protein N-terminal domain-containing protein n=1 Tax=Parelaphostrongylus tenuis TaxID=148309 RepID=A0AAD5MGL0_PARTN|nr:hypothetical protein KIN20_002306 [Parelaphostrongylus tenuis]
MMLLMTLINTPLQNPLCNSYTQMPPRLHFLLTILSLTQATSDLAEIFASIGDFDDLSANNVSRQCELDMTTFSKSLLVFTSTLRSCVSHGGCNSSQKEILSKNLYAAKQVDAFGKLPAGIMEFTTVGTGSYVECNEVLAPYGTHYCFARIQFSSLSAEEPLIAKLAVCMPRSCGEQDIPQLMRSVIKERFLSLDFPNATCLPINIKLAVSFWIFIAFASFIVLLTILATITDYFLHNNSCYTKRTTAMSAFLAFSFYSNGAVLLDVRPPKESILRSLASIRFISMTWVAAGHSVGAASMSESLLPTLDMWDPLLSTTITNGFLSVDTFFLLSGIIVAYLFFKSRPDSRFVKSPMTWVLFYVHRYVRLTPPMMLFIWFFVVTAPLTDGVWSAAVPMDELDTVEHTVQMCQQYWWRNMLYIDNYFSNSESCYGITWYLAVDTQLYIVAPIFLLTLYITPLIGYIVLLLSTAASVVYTYVITYRDNLPPVFVAKKVDQSELLFFDEFYQQAWTRCPPYLIGLGVGHFLAQCQANKSKLSKKAIVLGWIFAASIALCSLYTVHGYQAGDYWSKFSSATYNNFSRIGWALAVSWVIVANHLGWGGIIATFMDHPLWQPLGKLSYCAYIAHFYVIAYVFNLDDRPFNLLSIWQAYVHRAIPVIVLSYFLAFIWSCLIEIPTINLEKILVGTLTLQKKVEPLCSKPTSL